MYTWAAIGLCLATIGGCLQPVTERSVPDSGHPPAPAHLVVPGCGDVSALQAGSPWPMRGRCPTRVALAAAAGPVQPRARWTFDAGAPIVSEPVIDSAGNLYLGLSDALLSVGPDGAERWRFATPGEVRGGAVLTAADAVVASSVDGSVFSVDSNGHLRWQVNAGAEVHGSLLVTPEGDLVFGDEAGTLHALHADGSPHWTRTFGGLGAISGGASLDSTDRLWVGAAGLWVQDPATAYALDLDGGDTFDSIGHRCGLECAQVPLVEQPGPVLAPPTLGPDGEVYLGLSTGALYGGDSCQPNFGWDFADAGVTVFENGPAAAPDGRIFFGAPATPVGDAVFSMSINGGEWLVYQADTRIRAQLSLDKNGRLYVVTGTTLRALEQDGGQLWQLPLDGEAAQGVSFGADGTIYLGTTSGTLYSIGD